MDQYADTCIIVCQIPVSFRQTQDILFVDFIILRIAADNAYKHTISSIITTKLTIYRIKNRQLPPLGIHRRRHIFIECDLYIRMS